MHAAQADLALLSARFNARAEALIDTQVAAAFLGFGDQIGYANLVERLSDVVLDKGAQFSQWSKRPLSAEQLSYALDDVRYLPDLWHRMRSELERRGRLDWVTDECARLADGWAQRSLPEEMYRRVRGWNGLKPRAQGALREVAAWREQRSLEQNRPPSWLINDRTLLELCRTPPRDERELVDVRGLGKGMAERHGSVLLDLIARGQADPPPPRPRSARLPDIGEAWAGDPPRPRPGALSGDGGSAQVCRDARRYRRRHRLVARWEITVKNPTYRCSGGGGANSLAAIFWTGCPVARRSLPTGRRPASASAARSAPAGLR